MICAITGANGFLGRNLVRHFKSRGWTVVSLTRSPEKAPEGTEGRKFILGEPVPSSTLQGVDLLVHAAYDFSLCGWADICRVNVVGSDYLFDAATRARVKKQIFISSMSAFEGCKSHYGRGKLAAENAVRSRGGFAVRPGMIYSEDNGGIADKIAKVAKKLPVIPMIGRGDYPLYTCHVDDLCALILVMAIREELPNEIVTAANAKPVTLLEIAKKASEGKSRLIITIPWSWVALGLWGLERIGLRPGFRSDSVISLVNANRASDFATLGQYPIKFRDF